MSMSQQPFATNTSRTRTFSPPNSLAGQLPAQTSNGTLRSAAQHTRPISLPAVPAPLQMRSDSRRATVNAPFTGQNGLVQGASRPAASLASTTLPQSSRRASVMDSFSPPTAQDVTARNAVTLGQPVASRRQSMMHDLTNMGNRSVPSAESSNPVNSTNRQHHLMNGQTGQIVRTGVKQLPPSQQPRGASSFLPASLAGTATAINDYSGGEAPTFVPKDGSRHPTVSTSLPTSAHGQHRSRLTGGIHLKPVRSPPNQGGLGPNAETGDLRTNNGSQALSHG